MKKMIVKLVGPLLLALIVAVVGACTSQPAPTPPTPILKMIATGPLTIGPMTIPSPSGGGTANQPQTIDNTVRECGPLPAGRYTLEGDQDMYVIEYSTGHLPASTTVMANSGVRVPANTEVDFEVPGDSYFGASSQTFVAWTRVSASGTNFRINSRYTILTQ